MPAEGGWPVQLTSTTGGKTGIRGRLTARNWPSLVREDLGCVPWGVGKRDTSHMVIRQMAWLPDGLKSL